MISTRPSAKAVLVAGAIAMTLVVGATSGAVAGKLITSQDIKDGTIKSRDIRDATIKNKDLAPGSVDWERTIDDASKEMIESLVQAGPAGPAGPEGPRGVRGNDGAPGPAGMGKIVFWDYFGLNEPEEEDFTEFGYELAPVNGERIALDEPGDYLLTMRGLSLLLGPDTFGAAIVAGEPDSEEDFFFNSCIASGFLISEVPIATCSVTYPISVEPGESLDLPVYATSFEGLPGGCEEECLPPLAGAAVTVIQLNETPTEDPLAPGPCRTDLGKELKKAAAAARC